VKYVPAWVPGAQFQRDAKAFGERVERHRWAPFDMVKRKKATGESQPQSFVLNVLEDLDGKGGDIEEEGQWISGAAATLFGGGSDTLASMLLTFVLAMCLNPEVQAKARAELDHVVGDRLPSYDSDQESTPYLHAVIRETLRWHPPAPNGVPRRVREGDIYRGYLIPTGSYVIVNMWGILHDERRYPNPTIYDPERWLNPDNPVTDKTFEDDERTLLDPWEVVFGHGRRICPGIALARTEMWIALATILATFEIKPKVDAKTGRSILPEPAWSEELISLPRHYSCDIKPRSREAIDRLKDALAEGSVTKPTAA